MLRTVLGLNIHVITSLVWHSKYPVVWLWYCSEKPEGILNLRDSNDPLLTIGLVCDRMALTNFSNTPALNVTMVTLLRQPVYFSLSAYCFTASQIILAISSAWRPFPPSKCIIDTFQTYNEKLFTGMFSKSTKPNYKQRISIFFYILSLITNTFFLAQQVLLSNFLFKKTFSF